MTTKLVPLSETEKALFKKTHRTRLWIALIFGMPIISFIGYLTFALIGDEIDIFRGKRNDYDWGLDGYLILFFLVLMYLGLWFYFVPLYRKSFQNIRQTHKIIATTNVLNVQRRLHTKGGFTYTIQTDYKNIDTYFQIILTPIVISEIQPRMSIEIHHLEYNFMDIIKIVVIK